MADCFCLQKRKRDGTKWARGGYLLLANKVRVTVLSGEALSCRCGLTAGFHPLVLQSLFTMQVALKFNSCSSTLHGHRALVEAQNKDSPPALLLANRMIIHFLDHYWLMSTVISAFFFLCVSPMASLKLLWFLSASHLQWNSWPAPDPLMFHAPEVTLTRMSSLWQGIFSYAKINDSVLRWKNSLHQHHLYPLYLSLCILFPTCLDYKLKPLLHVNHRDGSVFLI